MSVELDLAGRIHSEFSGIVRLSNEMDLLAEEDFMSIGRRWSHALDILSKAARVHNGARKLLGSASPDLRALDDHPFCRTWNHDFARDVNTQCDIDPETLELTTCFLCKDGYTPCSTSMSNRQFVQHGMKACREMRDRYEHYEGYFTGTGNLQKATKSEPAATKPVDRSWVEEGIAGGTDGDEIRIDVYERSGRRAFMLNVRLTVVALKPVVRAVTLLPEVFNRHHEVACEYCK